MDEGSISCPEPQVLQETGEKCNFHVVGNDACPLRKDLVKPYPHRNLSYSDIIVNTCFSQAQTVVENAFEILANRSMYLSQQYSWNQRQ